MQICVFPVFTFPRIVNKPTFYLWFRSLLFALIIIAVSRSAHCSPFVLLVSFSMMALDIILMDNEFGYIGTKLSGSKAKLKVIQHSQQSPSLMNGSYYHFEL